MDFFRDFVDGAASNLKNAAEQAKSFAEETAGNAANLAEAAASTAADVAGNIASGVTETASNVGKAIESSEALKVAGDTAGIVIAGITETAGAAVSNVGNALNEHQQQREADMRYMLEEAERERRSNIGRIEDPSILRLLELLGESPIPPTSENVSRIQSAFPIPKEQCILWADAEFDLRPSGIIATDKGVFIKSDAVVFALPFAQKEETETCSRLTLIPWEYLEPECFTLDDENNYALTVDRECSKRFIAACRYITTTESLAEESYDVRVAEETHGSTQGMEGAMSTIVANQENLQFTENHAHAKNPGGHGEMAEEANTMIDRFLGMDAEVVGRDNAPSGPDRKVNGILIQTKYYNSARGTLESAFDAQTGQYRYIDANSQSPMQLEVPKDQYERAVEGFRKKIEQGKVPGVTNPAEAEKLIRKGHLTYKQAVNLTKPGTIESLAYDAATGVVMCSCAFGISFVAASYNAYRQTGDLEASIQAGIAAGVQVFGISFIQHVLVSQIARSSAANALMAPSQFVVEKLGNKATQSLVNALRALSGKTAIHGAAASKQLAKIFRSNVITTAITLAVFSVPETYNLANRRISGAQYVKNMTGLTVSVLGGAGGAVAAGAAAAKIAGAAGTAVAPGVGTAVGIAGGFVGGAASAAAAGAISDVLYEGDAAVISRILNAYVSCMAIEYMLDEKELGKLTDELDAIDSSEFKELFANYLNADNQEKAIRNFLNPRFEAVVSQRPSFALPSFDCIDDALSDMLVSIE